MFRSSQKNIVFTTIFSAIVLFVVFLIYSSCSVTALSRYGIDVQPYNQKDSIDFFNNIELYVTEATEQLNNSSIVNMDVSSNGYIVIALNNQSLLVFDDNGNIYRQFFFDAHGSYYVKWNYQNLVLFFVRSGAAIEFTLDCQMIGVYHVDSQSSIWNELRSNNTIVMGSNTYEIKKDMNKFIALFTHYSILSTTDVNGNETILYNANETQTIKAVLIIIVLILTFTVVPCIILKDQIKYLIAKRKGLLKEQVNEKV